MSTPILVTGGTGTLGRLVVRKLIAAGRDVRLLSRKDRPGIPPGTPRLPDWPEWFVGDLKTGAGLAKALEGVGIVLHCSGMPGQHVEATAQLQIAATRVGKPHIVYPSIIGADRIEHDAFSDRRAVERLLADGGLPWTVQRTSHFHEHIEADLRRQSRRPFMTVPAEVSFQPIAADEVAERLADLCTTMPANRVPDFAGPEIVDADDLANAWLDAAHKRRRLVVVRKPGKLHAGYRAGMHLAPDRGVGQQTFGQFLAELFAPKEPEPKPVKEPKRAKAPKSMTDSGGQRNAEPGDSPAG